KIQFSTLMTRTTTSTELTEFKEETTTLITNDSTDSSSAIARFRLWDLLCILSPISLLLI
ncbi:hypothetical protein BgiBS90_007763, partial [Biomphalaria glabrata]